MTRARSPHRPRFVAACAALAAASWLVLGACADRIGGDVAPPRADGGGDGRFEPLPDGEPPADAGPSTDAADAGSACPPGSTLRRTRATCPGSPLVPPAALATDLAAAAPGDVVSLAGMNESDAPCLPVVVCTPADAPALLFSDSPESPAQDGVLYADTVNAGRYRFYVYHANGGTMPRKFPIVVLNQGAQPAKVTIIRRGLAAPSTAYVSVGKTVLLDWFTDRAPVDVTVPAGQRVLLDPALDALHAGANQLVHAIYDVIVDRAVKVSVVSVLASADAAATTGGLALLPRDVDHQRGTFAAADVLVALADVSGAQKKGVQRLRLGLDEVDDTLEGFDAPTGDPQKLLGNYGMRYRFALGLPLPAFVALAPRGGGWGGVGRAGASSVVLPSASEQLATTTDAIAVGSADGGTVLELLTGGGSNLPVDLFLVTP